MNLLFTIASQPSYEASRHVIAQLSPTLINAFISVNQVHIRADVHVQHGDLHYGNCTLGQALHSASLVDRMELTPR